jgi:dTDP-4-dehydrorhamnose 3,5-epimerase
MASTVAAGPRFPRLASSGKLELVVPECPKGIGALVASANSPELIAGVRIEPRALYPDDRGYFLEVQRFGRGLAAEFPACSSQVSAALSFAGSIKAFHYHLHQTDCWTPVKGMFQIALVDLRQDSPTLGRRNTIYAGALRPWQILIPPGVGHGYKVIGKDDALLVYMTDKFYDPQDEGRIPYNDPSINYDWETQHK